MARIGWVGSVFMDGTIPKGHLEFLYHNCFPLEIGSAIPTSTIVLYQSCQPTDQENSIIQCKKQSYSPLAYNWS